MTNKFVTAREGEHSRTPSFPGKRHYQWALWFFLCNIAYGMRANLSVGILAMTSKYPPSPDIPTFPEWTQKNTMLSSFFWGYIILQVGAGKIAQRFGAKWPLAYAFFMNSLFCILTPVFAINLGEGGVIACRAIQGLHQGFIYPSLHSLAEKWAPLSERSRVVGLVYTGGPLGIFISMIITGEISDNWGWPYAFYLYGVFGMCWVAVWVLFGANQPSEHKTISKEELLYIEDEKQDRDKEKEKFVPTPWKDIFTSLPVWAILVGHAGYQWGFWVLVTETASYLKNIMNYDLENSSVVAGSPYLAQWVLNLLFSPMADWLINKRILSVSKTRKLMNSIGFLCPGAALIGLAFLEPSQKMVAIVLLIIAVGLNAAAYTGYNCNHIDIAPTHAGILMGITNGCSNILSILAPLSLNVIDKEETDPDLWKIVFLFSAGIYVLSNIFFVVFADGELQPWNNRNQNESEDVEKSKQI